MVADVRVGRGPMPRALSISGIVVAILLVLVFGLDVTPLSFPFWRGQPVRWTSASSSPPPSWATSAGRRCASP